MALEIKVFNVRRGLCVFIRTPNNYGILIDCGSSDDFSPIQFIKRCLPPCNPWGFYPLSAFILTHPHSDHISDLINLHTLYTPAILFRQPDLDWNRIRKSNQTNVIFDYYREFFFPPCDYDNNSFQYPNWGDNMSLNVYALPPYEAEIISNNDSEYTNNTSIVTIIKYRNYCFAINGDILAGGMNRLLQLNNSLTQAILGYRDVSGIYRGGVDFYLCPHHGHESGFSEIWFAWSGPTRRFNIASERRKGQNEKPEQTAISPKYSMEKYCLGWNFEDKKLVSTKSGNHINIEVHDNGKWAWGYF